MQNIIVYHDGHHHPQSKNCIADHYSQAMQWKIYHTGRVHNQATVCDDHKVGQPVDANYEQQQKQKPTNAPKKNSTIGSELN